jgi:arylsulfatase A-like enzyme
MRQTRSAGPLSRRDLLKTTALGSIALAAGMAGEDDAFGQPRTPPPNIVYMMADDLGYADVSCYGRPDLKTPNIDRIATKGVRFLQGYANSAVCSATRTALITGRYQYRLRLGLEEPLGGNNLDVGLPPEHPTLPSLLKAKGYGTTLVGKWHLGFLPKFSPLKSGYDHFYGFRSGGIDYYRHTPGSGPNEDFWDDDMPLHQIGYTTSLFGDRAVNVIDAYAKSRQPFFVSLHFNAPHWPWEAPGDEAESERLRAQGRGIADYDGGSQKTYREMITAMDTQIGRVLKTLEDNRLTNNTIVIFTSDNGGERFADTWPFSGHKTELLEGGLRIPSIISWPARLPQGKTSDQVSASMDWMPTLLAAADVATHPDYPPDGINLLPILTGSAPIQPRTLYWRYKANAQRAIRDGDLKYLKILDNTFLFNVVDDPLERANLKGRQPEAYERLSNKWLEWNQTMLPEVDESGTGGITGAVQADHVGAGPVTRKADNPGPPVAK